MNAKLVVVPFVKNVVEADTTPLEEMLKRLTPVEEATVKRLSVGRVEVPEIVNREDDVVVPTPTFPLAKIAKNEDPVDDATLNGLILDVDVACTLNAYEDDVALTPENIPLSKNDPVVKAVDDAQRASLPVAPPVSSPVIPRDEVDTHFVDVPEV